MTTDKPLENCITVVRRIRFNSMGPNYCCKVSTRGRQFIHKEGGKVSIQLLSAPSFRPQVNKYNSTYRREFAESILKTWLDRLTVPNILPLDFSNIR